MSKIDRHSDLTPWPKEQRIFVRALGCGVKELEDPVDVRTDAASPQDDVTPVD